jgi:GT2 family glycosyltransferase
MADLDHSTSRRVVYVIGACQLFRTALGRELGGMDVAIGRGGMADVDWCIRVWDSGRSVVYLPQATVVHDYRRASNQRPLSRQALHHLASFVLLQRRYRGRRRELARFADELDGEGSVSHIATQRPIELQAGAA